MKLLILFLIGICYSGVTGSVSALTAEKLCQGDKTTLSCPDHQTVQIYRANYGRFHPGKEVCPHKSLKYLPTYDCISDVTAVLEARCNGLTECEVRATNRNFGDPCRGVYKHLDIQFYCDDVPVTTTSDPPTTPPSSETLSIEMMMCTKIYRSVIDSGEHKECEAMQSYKDCLREVEIIDPASIPDIEKIMPTLEGNLESCFSATKQPLVKLCKHSNLEGACVNITTATSDLGDFDNSVKSIQVYYGNWALYTGKGYTGEEDRVKPGFTHLWLGIWAPVKGEPINLYSNDLSSLRPVDDADTGYYLDYTEPTTAPTSGYKSDEQGTPDFWASGYWLTDEPTVVTAHADPETQASYSQWVNLDDILTSAHPDMCRATYCLLGIRVIFSQLRTITLPTRQSVEYAILNRLLDVYQIYPEQLVLAETNTRTSEIILEIVDMTDAPKRVIDIAADIEQDIKDEEFTFTIAETILLPDSQRFGVMLKTISEEYLPKRIKLVTEPMPDDTTTEPKEKSTTPDNEVETDEWDLVDSTPTPDNSIRDDMEDVIFDLKAGIFGMPSKYFYPLLATALLLLVLACVVISTVVYRCMIHNREYTLIKKVPSSLSNIYMDVDHVTPPKKVEGFENPSYLLEEVDHM